jgi:DNA (cytosine-5)-methyltransferase 1
MQNGFEILWANEIDKNAVITYKENFNHTIYHKDIRDINIAEIPKVDVLTAGFPCQAFSIAGYQKGFCDDRGNVFFEILNFIDELKPEVLFLENVKNLKSHDKGNTFKIIKESLIQRGYYLKDSILNSCDYGVPQNRERIYIVGFKDKKVCDNFSFPEPIKLDLGIRDLIDSKVDDYYYYDKSKYYDILKQEMTNKETIYQWRRVYVRENKSNLCPTLTANMGTGGHNVPLILDDKDIRKLTPRECARFQGFPEDYKFPNIAKSHLYKQIGNSVSVPVISAIAREIKKALECVNMLMNSKNVTTKKSA